MVIAAGSGGGGEALVRVACDRGKYNGGRSFGQTRMYLFGIIIDEVWIKQFDEIAKFGVQSR